MQALNVSHLDFSTIEQVVGGLGTVLSTERSKGITVGFSLRRASPAEQVLFRESGGRRWGLLSFSWKHFST